LGEVDIDADGLHGTVAYVKASVIGGKIKLLENEIIGYKWITLEEFIQVHYQYGFSQKVIDEIMAVLSR